RERGVPKSHLVREAIVRYLAPADSTAEPPAKTITAAGLAARWPLLPRLTPDEAAGFDGDIARARRELPEARAAWE
ncbi:MAG: hypothetical protein HYS40_02790, partial [Gemmatimonadetes bacterium]|nr:hypothetical protein [Gemmatimonadota bacterium]